MGLSYYTKRIAAYINVPNQFENTEALYLIAVILSKSRGLNLAIDKEAKEKNVTSLGNTTTKQIKTKTTKTKTRKTK